MKPTNSKDKKVSSHPAKRVGNVEARPGKREAFKESKQERSNLADSISSAFAARTFNLDGPKVNSKVESVEGDVKPKKFKR